MKLATETPSEEMPELAQDVDAYVEDFTLTVMDEKGAVSRYLEGKRMVHYPGSATSEVIEPRVTAYDRSHSPWYVRSERGLMEDKSDHVQLLGQVTIEHTDMHGRALVIHTSDVELDTQRQIATTAAAVEIAHHGGVTRGVGMNAQLEEGRVSLRSAVRGEYAPVVR